MKLHWVGEVVFVLEQRRGGERKRLRLQDSVCQPLESRARCCDVAWTTRWEGAGEGRGGRKHEVQSMLLDSAYVPAVSDSSVNGSIQTTL